MTLSAFMAAAALPTGPPDELQQALQTLMDDLAAGTGFALSLGYVDETGDFGLGAGTLPDGKTKVTKDDTFMFGSGTKPFTAAYTVQLQEQGVLSLDDSASKYVDPALKALTGDASSSMVSILGAQGADVTVGNLIKMQSGIQDFDLPVCDDPVLEHGTSVRASTVDRTRDLY